MNLERSATHSQCAIIAGERMQRAMSASHNLIARVERHRTGWPAGYLGNLAASAAADLRPAALRLDTDWWASFRETLHRFNAAVLTRRARHIELGAVEQSHAVTRRLGCGPIIASGS